MIDIRRIAFEAYITTEYMGRCYLHPYIEPRKLAYLQPSEH